MFYLWPIICLLAGATVGMALDGVWILNSTSGPIVMGVAALCIGVFITMHISKTSLGNTLLRPRITTVIEKAQKIAR